jgi:rhodanese-related sulfurtransferase
MFKTKFLMLSILALTIMVSSCKKDEDPPAAINESEVLATYLESTNSPLGKDYVNTDMPSMITATDVNSLNLTGQVYIIDIRSAADFTTGHIKNAHNVAFADLLTHVKTINMADYTKVAIVCYTGQTASYGACLLRLMGYDKVFAMKWGMCSWNEAFAGKWNTAIANGNAYASQFTTTATEKGAAGEMPVLSTGKTTGQEILEARVDVLLTEGFSPAAVTNATVFGALTNYYIVNYWGAADYSDPGHIPGAIQYSPKQSMSTTADLKTLPTDKTIAVYCYTGQTSGYLTSYLRLLGYDAKSILYGTNGMIYDQMVTKNLTHFSAEYIMGYEYE